MLLFACFRSYDTRVILSLVRMTTLIERVKARRRGIFRISTA